MTNTVNVLITNLSTPEGLIINTIQEHGGLGGQWMCLSTHKYFSTERLRLNKLSGEKIIFKSFYQFLNDRQMEWCDVKAFQIEKGQNNPIGLKQARYFQVIKQLKNRLVLKGLKRKHLVRHGFLLSVDLGVDADTWRKAGFLQLVHPIKNHSVNLPDLKMMWRQLTSVNKLYILRFKKNNYLFLGEIKKLAPRLGSVQIVPADLVPLQSPIDWLRLFRGLLGKLIAGEQMNLRYQLLCRKLQNILDTERVVTILTTVHEYDVSMAELVRKLDARLIILQDGYLPANYTSRLYHYLFGVTEFWTWDDESREMFTNLRLKAKNGEFFNRTRLPNVNLKKPLRRLLVATSGAGDWTAFKDRAYEDLMVEEFAKVAQRNPDLHIIYRCHPLWEHPDHQGMGSIARVARYFKELGLTNIKVSAESVKQSKNLKGMWVKPSSMTEDIKKADIVFGEHSIAMIDAAEKGKMFASINLTNRRDLFSSFSRMGFPHLTCYTDIIELINGATSIAGYNDVVRQYNHHEG